MLEAAVRAPARGKIAAQHSASHRRIRWPYGVVHVFRPRGYVHATAGVVIYVHGYNHGVDEVWREHRLAEQFEESGQNALFVVPEAPRSRTDQLQLPPIAELFAALEAERIRVPSGPVIAVGHSGGYRSIARWIDDESAISEIILLDAFYGDPAPFERFLEDSQPERKMLIVSALTESAAESFADDVGDAVRRPELPMSYEAFSPRERRARLLLLRSQYGHSEMVENGLVLPIVLRLTPLRFLGEATVLARLGN